MEMVESCKATVEERRGKEKVGLRVVRVKECPLARWQRKRSFWALNLARRACKSHKSTNATSVLLCCAALRCGVCACTQGSSVLRVPACLRGCQVLLCNSQRACNTAYLSPKGGAIAPRRMSSGSRCSHPMRRPSAHSVGRSEAFHCLGVMQNKRARCLPSSSFEPRPTSTSQANPARCEGTLAALPCHPRPSRGRPDNRAPTANTEEGGGERFLKHV